MTISDRYIKQLEDQLTPELKARASRSMATPQTSGPFTFEGIKVLFLLFGGGATALATWFQHSLSGTASAAQHAMLTPILVALTSCIVGLLLTSILAVRRDKANLISHQFDVAQAQAIEAVLRFGIEHEEKIGEIVAEGAAENWDIEQLKKRLAATVTSATDIVTNKLSNTLKEGSTKLNNVRGLWEKLALGCYAMLAVAIMSIAIGGWNAVGLVKSDPCAQPAPPLEQSTTN